MNAIRTKTHFIFLLLSAFILTGCEGDGITGPDTFKRANDKWQEIDGRESIFGEGGLSFGGNDGPQRAGPGGTGIGVNAFLWRASLDIISFMPLASADPFGGVILTDWHSQSATPNERSKLNVYILGQALRSDGIRVAAFHQVRGANNEWQPVEVNAQDIIKIEDAILTKARQLRSESLTQ